MSEAPPAVWLSPADLTDDPLNPRHNEAAIAPIAASIRRFGFTAPVLARPDPDRPGGLVVIAGHTRLAAARSIGVERVPVRVLDVTEAEGRALMLSDNKLGEIAEWDDDGLAAILADLDADEGIDIGDLGWTGDELAAILRPVSIDDIEWTTFDESIGDGAKKGKAVVCPNCDHGFEV